MKKIFIILFVTVSLIMLKDTIAGSRKDIMTTTTTVLPVVQYEIVQLKNSLDVTEQDINQGYVDVQNALVISVRTNSTNGYILSFTFNSDYLQDLTIFDKDKSYKIVEAGDEVHMPYEEKNYIKKELSIRFHLLENIEPGTYQSPVTVAVSAM